MKWLYIYIHTCPGGGDLKDARYLFTSDYSLIIPHHMMKYISMEWSWQDEYIAPKIIEISWGEKKIFVF